ncbi:MAG: YcxB family protein [Eubacteriales bacterium]|nr:YcxB family protein [Eubacteriales bacterium]
MTTEQEIMTARRDEYIRKKQENGKRQESQQENQQRESRPDPGLDFRVQLTAADLWKFSVYHANSGFLGIFNLLFTCMALFLLVTRWSQVTAPYRLLLVVCALLFTVWQPLLLYTKARKQAKLPAVKEPMELTFGSHGLFVAQNGQNADFSWEQMGRMDKKRDMAVLYMDRIHAYLIPDRFLGEQKTALYELAAKHLPKERRKGF